MHETDYNASNKLKWEDTGYLDNIVVQAYCFNKTMTLHNWQRGIKRLDIENTMAMMQMHCIGK